jgi:GntR family transcriptional regulator/MocR family aminotransferase
MRELYQQRQQVLIDALAKSSRGAWQLAPSEQGLHLMREAAAGRADAPLSARAREAGVLLAPLSAMAIESPRRGWVLGYAGYETAALRSAARALGSLLK